MKFIIIFLLFVTSLSIAQKEANIDNNLTFTSTQSNVSKSIIGFNYTGDNSILLRNFDISSNTNYAYLNDNQNELSQRFNFVYKFQNKKIYDYTFLTYQFNSSLIRDIQEDHWVGLGYGIKNKIDSLTISTSYAIIYQDIQTNIDRNELFRHSLRLKTKLINSKIELGTEYFYQPNTVNFKDYIITGTTRLLILPKDKINFVILDIISYHSYSDVRLLNTISLGIQYKFNKKF